MKGNIKNNYKKWFSVLISFLTPGLGMFMSGQHLKGVLWFLSLFLFYILTSVLFVLPQVSFLLSLIIFLPVFIFLLLLMLYQSYKCVIKINIRTISIIFVIIILSTILCDWLIFSLIDAYKATSGCMLPTIKYASKNTKDNGDKLFCDKFTYFFRKPKRGEIIVASIPDFLSGNHFIKRIVGMPGEKISIKPPYIYINGKKLESPSIIKKISEGKNGYCFPFINKKALLKSETDEIQLGKDEYFILGDNSRRSLDSRYFGAIKGKYIIGRITRIYWPPSRICNFE